MDDSTDSVSSLLRQAFAYREALVRYGFAVTRDWAVAEDAVQEALILLARLPAPDLPHTLLPWLKEVVRRKSLALARSTLSRRCSANLDLLAEAALEPCPGEDDGHLSEERRALSLCLDALHRDLAALLHDHFAQQEPVEDLAQRLGKSVNAIRLRLSRGRRVLEDCVRRRLGGLPR